MLGMITTYIRKEIFNFKTKQVMKKYINPLLTFGTTMALLYVIYGQNEQLTKLKNEQIKVYQVPHNIDSLITLKDSLYDELFISKVQNGRYELSLDHLNEVNPKAGKEFQNFMEHETE
jgi:hypothetical protein